MKTGTIVSDTSSLIILTKLERLTLLDALFDNILIPSRVEKELQAKEDQVHQKIVNHTLFEIIECKDKEMLDLLDGILDEGEAEALVLAKERQMILLIDEKKGRKIAKNMKPMGSLDLIDILICLKKQISMSACFNKL